MESDLFGEVKSADSGTSSFDAMVIHDTKQGSEENSMVNQLSTVTSGVNSIRRGAKRSVLQKPFTTRFSDTSLAYTTDVVNVEAKSLVNNRRTMIRNRDERPSEEKKARCDSWEENRGISSQNKGVMQHTVVTPAGGGIVEDMGSVASYGYSEEEKNVGACIVSGGYIDDSTIACSGHSHNHEYSNGKKSKQVGGVNINMSRQSQRSLFGGNVSVSNKVEVVSTSSAMRISSSEKIPMCSSVYKYGGSIMSTVPTGQSHQQSNFTTVLDSSHHSVIRDPFSAANSTHSSLNVKSITTQHNKTQSCQIM